MKFLFLPTLLTLAVVFVKLSSGQVCNVDNLPPRTININEDVIPGETIASTSVEGVTAVRVLFTNGTETKFFAANLNGDNTMIDISATEELANSYMDVCQGCPYTPEMIEIHYEVTCGSLKDILTLFVFNVIDVNNKRPQFETTSAVYNLELPVKGAPVNWGAPIKVMDKDYLPENTALVFTVSDPAAIRLNWDEIKTNNRLDHYNVYISLADDFVGQELDFILYASDGVDPRAEFNVEININQLNPVIKTEGNPSLLKNEVNEVVAIATIGDGTDPSDPTKFLLKAAIDSLTDYFEVVVEPVDAKEAQVSLKLIKEFPPEEMGNLVRMNLQVKYDDTAVKASAPIALAFEGPTAISLPLYNKISVTGEETPGEDVGLIDPSEPGVQFAFKSEEAVPSYITLNEDSGVINFIGDDEITPGVDVFTVAVTRLSDGETTKTVIIIHRDPPIVPPTTEPPVETTTYPPCECPTTESVPICPTIETPVEYTCPTVTPEVCPTTEAPVECTCPTPEVCPTTEPPVETSCPTVTPEVCPPTEPPVDCTCPTVTPEVCPPTEPPVDCTCPTVTPEVCPTTEPPVESTCPTVTPEVCPPTEPPGDCTCPTSTPEVCPPTEPPGDCTCPTSTPEVCPPTEPPGDCTCPTSTPEVCPPTEPPADCTCPPPEVCSTTETVTGNPVTGTDNPVTGTDNPVTGTDIPVTGTDNPVTCPDTTTQQPCDCSTCPTSAPPESPATCPSVTCPTPECPTSSAPPECPVTCPTPECPTSSAPPECPVTCPPVTGPTPECPTTQEPGEDCSTGGLVAGVAVLATVSVITGAAAAYLAYTYIYKAGKAFIPSATEFAPRSIDPEMGNGKNSVNGNNFDGPGQGRGTMNSTNFGNSDFGTNGRTSFSAFNQPSGGFDTFDTLNATGATDPVSSSAFTAAPFLAGAAIAPKIIDPIGPQEYSYVSGASDISKAKNPETASVVESMYAQPASDAGRKASLAKDEVVPKVAPEPVDEPKVDYNRVAFGEVEIIPDDSPDAAGTDVSDDIGGEEDNTDDNLQLL